MFEVFGGKGQFLLGPQVCGGGDKLQEAQREASSLGEDVEVPILAQQPTACRRSLLGPWEFVHPQTDPQ